MHWPLDLREMDHREELDEPVIPAPVVGRLRLEAAELGGTLPSPARHQLRRDTNMDAPVTLEASSSVYDGNQFSCLQPRPAFHGRKGSAWVSLHQ